MALGTALKAFWAALVDREKATQIERVLSDQLHLTEATPVDKDEKADEAAAPPAPARDHAVTLLATLQREARFIDLIQEDLGQYADAQVGAAARPCLQQCATALNRLFELAPLVEAGEGETVNVPDDASPMRYQWIGEGTAASGKLIHHGWQATRVELPEWSGTQEDTRVVAPAQVQAS